MIPLPSRIPLSNAPDGLKGVEGKSVENQKEAFSHRKVRDDGASDMDGDSCFLTIFWR